MYAAAAGAMYAAAAGAAVSGSMEPPLTGRQVRSGPEGVKSGPDWKISWHNRAWFSTWPKSTGIMNASDDASVSLSEGH